MSERVHDTMLPGVSLAYDANRVLSRNISPYQELVLIENQPFGRVLLLDGATQVTTADEFIYHEMLAHVPIFSHGDVRDVLIIGGGDGGLAEEVLKHKSVRRVVQVELDACVVDVSRRFLSEINSGVFEDERFQLHIGDGAAFIQGLDERFDLVPLDSTDPVGAAAKLFTASFYRAVRRCLRVRGLIVAQAGAPFVQPAEFQLAMRNLAQTFRFSGCYLLASPSYFAVTSRLVGQARARRSSAHRLRKFDSGTQPHRSGFAITHLKSTVLRSLCRLTSTRWFVLRRRSVRLGRTFSPTLAYCARSFLIHSSRTVGSNSGFGSSA